MALKVSLVIEGESKSAVKAAGDTTASLKELKAVAGGAAEQTGKLDKSTSFLSDTAKAAAPEIRKVAAGLTPIAQGGQAAAAGLIAGGDAAVKAGAKFSFFRTLLTGIAGGLVAGGLVVGVTAAIDAVGSLFSKVSSSGKEGTATLKDHEAIIQSIEQAYSEAADAASRFRTQSRGSLELQGAVAIDALEKRLSGLADRVALEFDQMSEDVNFSLESVGPLDSEALNPFSDALSDLVSDIRSGDADFDAFRERIFEIANTSADEKVRATATEVLALADAAANSERSIRATAAALEQISGKGVITALQAEIAALGRSSIERKIDIEIRKAGIGVTAQEAAAIRGLVIERERETEVQKQATEEKRRAEAINNAGRESVVRLISGLQNELEILGESNPVQRELIELRGILKFATDEEADAVRGLIDARNAEEEANKKRDDDAPARLRREWTSNLQGTIGQIRGFTGVLGAESGKWETINKAAGIANALISTYTGAAKALELGPLIGPPLAALTVATGLAYVAQIASGGSGSGGGGVASASTASSTSVPQQAQAQEQGNSSTFNIKLVGNRFSGEDLEELFRKINDGLADGHRIAVQS